MQKSFLYHQFSSNVLFLFKKKYQQKCEVKILRIHHFCTLDNWVRNSYFILWLCLSQCNSHLQFIEIGMRNFPQVHTIWKARSILWSFPGFPKILQHANHQVDSCKRHSSLCKPNLTRNSNEVDAFPQRNLGIFLKEGSPMHSRWQRKSLRNSWIQWLRWNYAMKKRVPFKITQYSSNPIKC